MPVMKQLRIGSATYDTVGEASVTQTLTSGTEIATVTIDGTATKLYAPEGGGMLVTFTEANYTYTADKTFGEIAAALDAGIMPSLKFVPATSSNHPIYAGIAYFSIENSSYYAMRFTAFNSSTISGSPSSYPSWSSDN